MLALSAVGNLDLVRDVISKYGVTDISHVRGHKSEARVLGQRHKTQDWNCLLLAIYHGHMNLVKYFYEEFGLGPFSQMLTSPVNWEYTDKETMPRDQCFGLSIIISNKDAELLNYVWNIRYLWESEHVTFLLPIISRHWPEKILEFMKSPITQELFINIPLNDKIAWIRTRFEAAHKEVIDGMRETLSSSPYCVALATEYMSNLG